MTKPNEQLTKDNFCHWNPKNLPSTKTGTCQNPDHYEYTDDKKRGQNLRLTMRFSDEYETNWLANREKRSDDEYDKLYDEFEKKKWKPNTEEYWCEKCYEVINE